MTRTLLVLSGALLFTSVSPVAACGERPSTPAGMVVDEARLIPLGRRVLEALDRRDEVRSELMAELEADEAYKALVKSRDAAGWGSAEEKRLSTLIDKMTAGVWDRVKAAAPVNVDHMSLLCGSVTLEDGHSINAGSSWSISNDLRPELGRLHIGGAEMHYLLDHGQATPKLSQALEELLRAPTPSPDAPPAPPARQSSLDSSRANPISAVPSNPRWD